MVSARNHCYFGTSIVLPFRSNGSCIRFSFSLALVAVLTMTNTSISTKDDTYPPLPSPPSMNLYDLLGRALHYEAATTRSRNARAGTLPTPASQIKERSEGLRHRIIQTLEEVERITADDDDDDDDEDDSRRS